MNRVPSLVAGVLLTCGGAGIAAAAPQCESFTGTLTLQVGTCADFKAAREKERIFNDTSFWYDVPDFVENNPDVPICFNGSIVGVSLDGQPVDLSSLSALAVNGFYPSPIFVAASIVTVKTKDQGKKDKDKELGSIFLRDTGYLIAPPSFVAAEQLIGVGGTKRFTNASVSMEILGDEVAGADVKGTICR